MFSCIGKNRYTSNHENQFQPVQEQDTIVKIWENIEDPPPSVQVWVSEFFDQHPKSPRFEENNKKEPLYMEDDDNSVNLEKKKKKKKKKTHNNNDLTLSARISNLVSIIQAD